MGSSLFNVSTPFCTPFTKFGNAKLFLLQQSPSSNASFKLVRPLMCTATIQQSETATRRSANYPPPLWDDRYIQSLTSVNTNDETHNKKAEKLKNDVRLMIQEATTPSDKLHLIDTLQRLGLSYHFEDIIETCLRGMYMNCDDDLAWKENDLFTTSLQFRLFRDHGFHVHQDVFVKFTDESGEFLQSLSTDTEGLLALYEASYLSIEGEPVLDKARDFSTRHLVNKLQSGKIMNDVLAMQVTNTLELPLHWMMLRMQAREFIELYEQKPDDMNPVLLEHAKLDFNLVQSIHQKDLKIMSGWWKKTGLAEKLPFARNRLLENFLAATGVIFEPRQGYCRHILTKINVLIAILDDMYDVYGTLEELLLFTDAVKRWDVNTMDELPDYMKICFLALFNSTNEMAYETLKEHGYNPISQMKKAWVDLTKAYMTEVRWYQVGYIPTLDEYLDIACITVALPVSLVIVFFSVTNNPISKEALECLEASPAIVRCLALFGRLIDDLATSSDEMKRGDVPKSMQCYMNETGASEEEARAHIESLLSETFKKMNNARFTENRHLSKTFIAVAMNIFRTMLFFYKHGDGLGHLNKLLLKDRASRILIEPIHID